MPARWRQWTLMLLSVVAMYWLQPALPIRNLDFYLPLATLGLALGVWAVTATAPFSRQDALALGLTAAVVIGLSATRYLIPELRPTPSRPPATAIVIVIIAVASGFGLPLWRWARGQGRALALALLGLIGVFIQMKTPALTENLAAGLRTWAGQSTDLASVNDLQWLGFSYVAFRLIHLLRDRQSGRLPHLPLREHLTFVIFFPAFTAGPIDRAERFREDWERLPTERLFAAPRVTVGLGRIAVGLFKKFVLADTLALFALNAANAEQLQTSAGAWLLLYAYAFRLYLDFSGYTDIAIGIGILFGVTLPENFDRPYLKNNITAFWQSWHMTLSNWARFYVFSPLSRALLRRKPRPNPDLIVFASHLATMLVIGLWHGVTVNFMIWGAWHGVALFIHKNGATAPAPGTAAWGSIRAARPPGLWRACC
ncbi:MAG: hypothetical protein HC915_10005 [Anaerolineae bacterium]|nr:hypothetical protein [Anaerolineae bacterium]